LNQQKEKKSIAGHRREKNAEHPKGVKLPAESTNPKMNASTTITRRARTGNSHRSPVTASFHLTF
jgi:hypothetical protein